MNVEINLGKIAGTVDHAFAPRFSRSKTITFRGVSALYDVLIYNVLICST